MLNKKLKLSIIAIATMVAGNVKAQTFYQCLPLVCDSGEYLDLKENKCKTCPDGYYQTAIEHTQQSCQPCKTVTIYYDRWYDYSPFSYSVSSYQSASYQYEKTYTCNSGASTYSACMVWASRWGSSRDSSKIFTNKTQTFKMTCDKKTGKICAVGQVRTICGL